jgi:hypothetical protein
MPLHLELSPTLANVRPATNRGESEREKRHHHALRGYPNADWTRPSM